MKKNKKEKLEFEKFTVAELSDLKSIHGGLEGTTGNTIEITILMGLSGRECSKH